MRAVTLYSPQLAKLSEYLEVAMPSATHDFTNVPPDKKRRRDYEHDYEPYQLPYHLEGIPARHTPNPTVEDTDTDDRILAERMHGNASSFASAKSHQSPIQRKMMASRTPNKKARISGGDEGKDARSPSRQSRPVVAPSKDFQEPQDTVTQTRWSPGRNAAAVLRLSRCHTCHRKPTKKSDLDDFADCESCGQRTCFICIRQCSGWRHRDRTAGDKAVDLSVSITMEDALDGRGTPADDMQSVLRGAWT
ncbi:hypothetical protein P8C59_007002 [Phyllachora maydis]|uniref:Uncharacterized protein n=1 Tax=Phyllachora maydis TaxID=1825666 RepID=A0AAD9I7G1_9PEZI|nr:hypothetical protein P8C59_007002 [Phyllachora maydis]